MNLLKATGTIGGLTLVSRIAGFARDLILARVLGAGLAADAFFVAQRMPNLFRRLFAEGAFSAAYVPMFAKRLHGEEGLPGAERFSQDVLSVFVPALLLFVGLFELVMPGFIWLMASGYADEPAKFDLTVELSRIAFPYLLFISIVALLTGILNSMSRFAAGAAAPILFNLTLVAGALTGAWLRGPDGSDATVARAMAVAISLSGLVQLIWLWFWVRRTGFRLTLRRPRLTPEVRQFGRIFLPATIGAGVYQLSILIETFFATRLPEGSMAYLNYADRLNQLPLGVIGIALGTAILPAISRQIATGDEAGAGRVQGQAVELAMLITLPAAIALGICAGPLVEALFVGGRFTLADARVTGGVLAALVCGLPAYVLAKVLTPGFFARGDTKTPVQIAAVVLGANVLLNIVVVARYGIVGLAGVTAACSWLNVALLYGILHRRAHFALGAVVRARLFRQAIASLLMAALLIVLRGWLAPLFAGSGTERLAGVIALCAPGLAVYLAAAWIMGATDKGEIMALFRRGKAA
jgi:putative peptidoglycan lipid II flippase